MAAEQAERGSTGGNKLDGSSKRLLSFARILFAAGIILGILGLWQEFATRQGAADINIDPREILDLIFNTLLLLLYGIVGLIILSRHPRHGVGWLMVTLSFLFSFNLFWSAVYTWALEGMNNGLSPLIGLVVAFINESWLALNFIPWVLIPLYFPSGNLISKRYRTFVMLTLISLILLMLSYAISVEPEARPGEINPFGIEGTETLVNALTWLSTPALLIGFMGGLYSFYARYRHANSAERSQIKMLIYLLAVFVSAMFAAPMIQNLFGDLLGSLDFSFIAFFAYMFMIPTSIGFAILRYNMWNIDVVINRTAVYGAMTLSLFLLFGGILFAITSLFSEFANGPLIAGVIAAGAFGAGFQPLRRGLQRFIDQRFYNIQIDYQKTPSPLQHFSSGQTDTQFGKYRGLELIGRGGMAEVYRAFPDGSNQPVAIKILPQDLAHDPEYRKRFEREVQVMLSLDHPNIVNVSKYGEVQDLPFIEMEFIRGRDLANHLTQVGRSSTRQTAEILSGIASALDYAHKKGLIHRDIKPSNVMLDQESDRLRPVLMDFGVAKILGRSMLTHLGFLGTLDYISPEQIQGEENINHQADIYSLAIVAYQMLSGELPFRQKNPGAILLAHISQSPPDIRELQPQLSKETARAIIKALSKLPSERFETATEFVNALNL